MHQCNILDHYIIAKIEQSITTRALELLSFSTDVLNVEMPLKKHEPA